MFSEVERMNMDELPCCKLPMVWPGLGEDFGKLLTGMTELDVNPIRPIRQSFDRGQVLTSGICILGTMGGSSSIVDEASCRSLLNLAESAADETRYAF